MCFSHFGRICHWGPLTALAIIKFVTATTVYSLGMWWPATTVWGFLHTCCFVGLSGLTLYNFLSSMYIGPGYVPLNWQPNNLDTKHLQFCNVCQGFKAPRSHHCRKCSRCILKMDHHCPWINNCVGWGNHAHFTSFLTFATLGCVHGSVILSCSLYRAIHRVHYLYHGDGTEPIVSLGVYGVILNVLALGFTIGVVIAVGMLLFFQIRAIVRNRTGIEDWILEKANFRRKERGGEVFRFPYDLGFWRNVRQVVNLSCQPVGDGIVWPVAEGCDQYTLTKEQIEQKADKRHRSKLYAIVRPASGSWCPLTHGVTVCCCQPLNDEARIKLAIGDHVLVTRWRKHWMFGDKVLDGPEQESSVQRIRGWFPRHCGVECTDKRFAVKKKTN